MSSSEIGTSFLRSPELSGTLLTQPLKLVPIQKHRCRLVVRVLRDKFPLNGEGENGLAEVVGLDGVGVVEKEVEVALGGRFGEAGQGRAGEGGLLRVACLQLCL